MQRGEEVQTLAAPHLAASLDLLPETQPGSVLGPGSSLLHLDPSGGAGSRRNGGLSESPCFKNILSGSQALQMLVAMLLPGRPS